MRKLLAVALAIIFSAASFAQSNPGFTFGQVPTASQWNGYFSEKQDVLTGAPFSVLGNASSSYTAPIWLPLTNCNATNQALTWIDSGGFGCNTISVTAVPGGSSGQVQYNSSGALAGTPGITISGSTPTITSPVVNGTFTGSTVIPAANGGSGEAGTITGALKGNGTSAYTQAACADLSNGASGCSTAVGTAATVNTGTSGATVPLNNSNNTSSGNQTHTGTENFTGPIEIGGTAVTLPVPVAIGGTGAATAQTAYGNITIAPGTFYVGWYGALGVSSDDCPAIQNALDAAAAYGAAHGTGTVVFDGISYNCKTSLTYDPAVTSVRGNGAAVNASAMTASPVVNVTQTHTGVPPSGSTYEQTYSHSFQDMFFWGPGSGSSVDLFLFQSADGSPQPNSRSVFKNIASYSFRNNYVMGNHGYLVKVENFNIGYSAKGIYTIRGSTDAGEQISFSHGVIDHTTSAVYNDGTFTLYINDVSFDFDPQWIYTAYGQTTCYPCHGEDTAAGFTQPKVFADGFTGSTIYWHGGDWNVDGAGPVVNTSAFVSINPPGQVIFDGAFFNNMAIGSTAFSSGAGVLSLSNTKTAQFAQGFFATRDSTNIFSLGDLLSDGSFENSSIEDLVWIGADTANVVYRTSGTNVSAALSTDTSLNGTQSLKITKANNAGAATVYIAAPFPKQQLPLTQSSFSVLGGQTGSITFTLMYMAIEGFDGNGLPMPNNGTQFTGKTQTVGSLTATKTLTGSPVSWSSTSTNADGDSPTRAPLWATHIVLKCDAASMNAGSFYVDNVVFNSM